MTRILLTFLVVFCVSCKQTNQTVPRIEGSIKENVKVVKTIAFGSCNHEDDSQKYWDEILKEKPDVWIWGGDNIYANSRDMSVLKRKYDSQLNNPYYQNFISEVDVFGTWDDHDYGANDGNKLFELKEESKTLALDFLGVSNLHEVRLREGIYQDYILGEPGQQIKLLLLDTRSFQDPLKPNPSGKSRYLKSQGDLLGEEQWIWLENELYENEAEVHIIMSSIQFIAEKHGFEKWDNFPNSKDKMIEIIHYSNARNVIFLSGDRHIGEISRLKIDSLNYPLYDITSSGLTHSYTKSKEVNPYRIGALVVDKNYGILNFDWKKDKVHIQCKIKGMDGSIYVHESLGEFALN